MRRQDQRLARADRRRHSVRRHCRRHRSWPARPACRHPVARTRRRRPDAPATDRCRSARPGASDECASRSASAMMRSSERRLLGRHAARFPYAMSAALFVRHRSCNAASTRLISPAASAMVPILEARRRGIGDRGNRAHRVAQPHHPVAARRCRHRLDRQFILLHSSRSQPASRGRSAAGRARAMPGRSTAAVSTT